MRRQVFWLGDLCQISQTSSDCSFCVKSVLPPTDCSPIAGNGAANRVNSLLPGRRRNGTENGQAKTAREGGRAETAFAGNGNVG